MSELKRTPLYEAHVRHGSKRVPFAGYEMPLMYQSLLEEHRAVRERAGLFDVSHMGEIVLSGPDALRAVQRLVTNDLSRCQPGQAMYAAVCNERGGIVDDVVVYRRAADDFLVCVNASNREKDFAWFVDHTEDLANLVLKDEGDDWAQLALQGPKAQEILAKRTKLDLSALGTYRFAPGEVAGRRCLVARTGYTGEDGFELFCAPKDAMPLWDALLEAGAPEGLIPCGLGARDSLRTELKYCLYGNDIDDDTTPLEAGLSWIVRLNKGEPFVGEPALAAQKVAGIGRKLVGFRLTEKGIPRHGYPVLVDGKPVSEVRSGTLSPTLDLPIGMAYLPTARAEVGSRFAVEIRGRPIGAEVVVTPFYKRAR
ncbi:MAG: glycine cleavage system aminomethyltransferase GcvT [Deltaproteobacteria bacterium]